MSTQQKKDVTHQAPRPSLDQFYKPVGIQAVTAATLCNKKSFDKKTSEKVKH